MLGWRKDSKREDDPQGAPATAAPTAGATASPASERHQAPPSAPQASSGQSKRLGEMLFEEGHITRAQLDAALAAKDKDGTFVGKALVDLGYIDQKTLQSILVKQCKIPHISLLDYEINGDLLKLLPEDVCLRLHILPIDKLGRILTVAMVDPLDFAALEEVRAMCPDLRLKPILCDWDHFVTVSRRLFKSAANGGAQVMTAKSFGLAEKPAKAVEEKPVAEAPAARQPAPEAPAARQSVPQAPVAKSVEVKAPKVAEEAPRSAPLANDASTESVEAAVDTLLQEVAIASPKLKSKFAASPGPANPKSTPPEKAPEHASKEAATHEAVPTASAEVLASQMRAGIEQVMQRAVDGLADQIKDVRASMQAPAVPSSQDLSRMVHENVQDAVQQTLAPMLERMGAEKGPAVPSAQELAQAIGGSVREAVEGTVGSLAKELHDVVSQREPAAPTPSAQEMASVLHEGIRGAMQEAVAAITIQASQSLGPASSMPSATELAETIRGSVQAAMTDVVAALADHTRQITAAARIETPPAPSAQDVAEAVRSSVQDAMKEVASAMAEQTRQMAALVQADDGPSPDDLADLLGTSVRNAMQDALKALGDNVVAAAQQNGAPLQEAIAMQAAQAARTSEEMHRALEAMRNAVTAANEAQESRETRFTELLETLKNTKAAEPEGPKAGSIEPFPEGGRRKGDDRYDSVTVLRRREDDAKEALLGSEVLGHSDERVRAALEAENTLEQLTFENYLVGKGNAFTVALGKAVAEAPGREYNPFFLYGEVGTGKTHLINAIANHVQKANRDFRVGYVSAGRFARRLMEALKDGEIDAFRENYCHCDLLVFDDIQFLAGHDEVQEEFFHIFNALQMEGRQIILAADKAPDKLGQLEKRLVSRFSGGIVASLVAPDWETRMKILHNLAQESAVDVPEEILALIATRVANDVRKMSGCLRKVVAFAKLMDRELTCDLAGEILKHLGVEAA